MIPSAFEYYRPATVQEALSLLNTYKDEAKVLAGGHSLLPAMKLRLANPKHIIDLGRIPNFGYIKESGSVIVLGAGATHYAIETSTLLRQKCPLLVEAAPHIGDVQVRHRGTIGGSLAHADPAADWPGIILALDAELKAASLRGERVIKARDFFVDLLTTALQPDELLTEIRIPVPGQRTGSAYHKLHQKASGFAIVGAAVVLSLGANRTCEKAAVGINGVAAKAYRAAAVETALVGQALQKDRLAAAAEHAADGVEALADIHASAEYRQAMARVYTRRALEAALAKI